MATENTITPIHHNITTATTTTIGNAMSGTNDEGRIKAGCLQFRNKGGSTNTITLQKTDQSGGNNFVYEVMEFTLAAGEEKKLVCDISQKGSNLVVQVITSSTSALDVTGTRVEKIIT